MARGVDPDRNAPPGLCLGTGYHVSGQHSACQLYVFVIGKAHWYEQLCELMRWLTKRCSAVRRVFMASISAKLKVQNIRRVQRSHWLRYIDGSDIHRHDRAQDSLQHPILCLTTSVRDI
jgi:hypothetical protein